MVHSAIPMVGFGFMDNIIMIQAGDYIDQTLGVTLGISTLTAAACGNICSDVSGTLCGGAVESFVDSMRIERPVLTAAQLRMRVVRFATIGGAALGVVCGCLLGSTSLLFMDLEKAERLKRATELKTIFDSVLNGGRVVFPEASSAEDVGFAQRAATLAGARLTQLSSTTATWPRRPLFVCVRHTANTWHWDAQQTTHGRERSAFENVHTGAFDAAQQWAGERQRSAFPREQDQCAVRRAV